MIRQMPQPEHGCGICQKREREKKDEKERRKEIETKNKGKGSMSTGQRAGVKINGYKIFTALYYRISVAKL